MASVAAMQIENEEQQDQEYTKETQCEQAQEGPTVDELQKQIEEMRKSLLDLRDIREAELQVQEATRNVESLQSKLKEAKEELSDATTAVLRLIRASRPMPLFESESNCSEVEQQLEKLSGEKYDENAWRVVDISELRLSSTLESKLRENQGKPINTIGDLSDWTMSNSLSDIKGIGSGKATKIEESLDAFWSRWNQQHPEELQPADDPDSGEVIDQESDCLDGVSSRDGTELDNRIEFGTSVDESEVTAEESDCMEVAQAATEGATDDDFGAGFEDL